MSKNIKKLHVSKQLRSIDVVYKRKTTLTKSYKNDKESRKYTSDMTEVMHKGSDSDTSPLKATAAAATTTNRRAIRGRAAALLANNDSSSDSDDNSAPISKSKPTAAANSKGKSQSSGGGIYYQVLNQTKKEIKENHLKLDAIVDSSLIFFAYIYKGRQ